MPYNDIPGQLDQGQVADPAVLRVLLPCPHYVRQPAGEPGTLNLAPRHEVKDIKETSLGNIPALLIVFQSRRKEVA